MPPDDHGVYLISEMDWKTEPDAKCKPLYVGSNTSDSPLFRRRVGSLVADIFGLYSHERGHHSGGKSINWYCQAQGLDPRELYIGWLESVECHRCAEVKLYETLGPELNKVRPARCNSHTVEV